MSSVSRFSKIKEVIDDNDLIFTDKYLDMCLQDDNIVYLKRDFLYLKGNWRGNIQVPPLARPWQYCFKKLVVGHSDIFTSIADSILLKMIGVARVFGVNTMPWGRFAKPIPLGLSNFGDDSPRHRILGNPAHLSVADQNANYRKHFDGTIYINFTASYDGRKKLLRTIEHQPDIIIDMPEFSAYGRTKYLEKLRKYSLVPCPVGNGLDTHRLWETLYMGGTPVIIEHPAINPLVADLPVISILDWQELCDLELMETRWNSLMDRKYKYETLTASYWTNCIRNA